MRRARRIWLPALGVAALIGIVIAVNPLSLWRVLHGVSAGLLALMLPTVIGVYIFRTLAWWVTLRRIGVRIGVLRALRVMFASRPLTFLPFGELGRVAVLEATGVEGVDAGELIGTVAFQELIFLTLMGLALLPGLVMYPALDAIVGLLLLLELSIVGILFWERGYLRAVAAVERFGLFRRFDGELRRIRTAFLRLFHGPTFVATVALNAAAVTLAFALFLESLHAVGAVRVGFGVAAMAYALAFLLSSLSFIPGSLGAYEGILTVFMAIQGVPPAQGAAAALLYRGFNDLLIAAAGTPLLLPLRGRLSQAGQRAALRRAGEPAVAQREEVAVGQHVQDATGHPEPGPSDLPEHAGRTAPA
jgi:uncharacterized membrane protein YbhN (UPF0104 family)